jgi:hypothetical protein
MKNFNSIFENKEEEIRPAKKGEGADDKEYLEIMSEYKVVRHKDNNASVELLAQAQDLIDNGDVSKNAKLAAAYL